MMRYGISNLIDLPRIQYLTDSFYSATGVPSSLISAAGTVVVRYGWQDICTDFHRKNSVTEMRCVESNTTQVRRDRAEVYKCLNGLMCVAAPVVVRGEHIASVKAGQFLLSEPKDEELKFFENQVRECGFEASAYFEALNRVPVISERRMEHVLKLLAQFAELLMKMCLNQLRQREISKPQSDDESEFTSAAGRKFDVIYALDSEGHITYVSPSLKRVLGYVPEEITGKHFSRLFSEGELPKAIRAFNDLMKGDAVEGVKLDMLRKDQTRAFVEFNMVPFIEADKVVKIQGIARDITEREHEVKEIERSREHFILVNQILRHDIVNNLSVIKSALRLYKNSMEEVLLGEVSDRVDKSLELVDRMAELESSISSYRGLRPCNLDDVIREVIANYPSVTFEVDGSCQVMADEVLSSVIDNIVRNAVIHGRAECISIGIEESGSMCDVRIADYGEGISDEIKEKIFDEGFVYGDTGHTGLGLHIVKKAMENYGGYVFIEDNEPKGTVFVLRLKTVP
jgi:PAS domain S-box-containing protein